MNYANSTSTEIIYVRVEEIADPTNFEVATFELSVNTLPVFSINDVTICQGSTTILNAGLISPDLNFEWYKDNLIIPGANSGSIAADQAGVYKLVVTVASTGCSYTDSAVVTVIPGATAAIIGYSLEDQWVQIEGTPSAVVTFTIDGANPISVIISSTGALQVSLPVLPSNSIICLTSVTASTVPFCTIALSNCTPLIDNPTDIVNIPDANFKAKLIELGVDSNNDGEIQYSEAAVETGTLYVSGSNIADLMGLEAFINLTGLYCSGNNLTQVDVSHIQGDDFDFSANPNLQYINMKNGALNGCTVLLGFCCDYICAMFLDLPSLQYVCIDENEANTWTIPAEINLNTYCSFDVGGNYNTITGSVVFDFDNNGCTDNDAQPFIKMNINNGSQQGTSFADEDGNYIFYTQEGNFTITPQLESASLFTISPATATVNFPTNNNLVSTNNFCITPNGLVPNAEIVVAPVTPARPGFDAEYKIVYKNTGNQILSGQVYFYYFDNVLDLVSTSVPTSSEATGLLTWNYTDLHPFESRSINVTLNVNGPMETPAVNNGDELIFNVGLNPINNNEIQFSYPQIVVGSFDPNDIICLEGESEAPSAIGNYLHYIVNFENTGTAPAENVVVKVDIDATKYDVSSLQLLDGSHPVQARVKNNVAEFVFKMINLETNGHGNILLKIRSKESLNVGDTVTKKANIFFDYNFPILTNDANTTFQDLSIAENLLDNSIKIYPNPSHDVVNIEANSTINSVQVYDIQGRLLLTHLANDLKTIIDISDKANGIYFFKIYSDKGIKVERIIKK
ncbi:MAG: T9SS type A sorting domain-containing protein [Flavobacterium sp.]|nr:MAG: T9SS type A sorting domain-containing protein [Flavobacterium sp.]